MRRCVVISGASKGIGKATAQTFINEGSDVINLSRTPCDIAGVQNLIVDMTREAWAEEVGPSLKEKIGENSLISVVHNAALLLNDSVEDITADSYRRVLELNVIAPSILNTLILPLMSAGSSIIYVSSTLGRKAVPNSFSYVSSKHALIGMMKATCQDLVGKEIHTAAVCPGFTDTEMLRSHIGQDPAVVDAISATVVMGRLIEPAEIADVIYFCTNNPVVNSAIIDANLGQIET